MMRLLRVFAFLFVLVSFWSCNDDDDYSNFHYVATHIDSIAMPDTANLGHRIPIKTYTTMKSNCQQFQMHGYDIVGNERTVTTWMIEWDEVECGNELVIEPMFFFEPLQRGNYYFRFWTGQDAETQEDVFITKEIFIQ